jgi:hypothetical protein
LSIEASWLLTLPLLLDYTSEGYRSTTQCGIAFAEHLIGCGLDRHSSTRSPRRVEGSFAEMTARGRPVAAVLCQLALTDNLIDRREVRFGCPKQSGGPFWLTSAAATPLSVARLPGHLAFAITCTAEH